MYSGEQLEVDRHVMDFDTIAGVVRPQPPPIEQASHRHAINSNPGTVFQSLMFTFVYQTHHDGNIYK